MGIYSIVWEVVAVQYPFQVGVMYCRAGQQTEEEMYNNEEGGPAFNEFLDLIGQRVRLKGFNKYKAGLCNKSKLLVHFQPAISVFLSQTGLCQTIGI